MIPADYQLRRQQIEMQQQMGQQQPMGGSAMMPQSQQSMGSPLSQGSHTAIAAARQAMAPDESQRQRAMGAGMGAFFSQMGQNRPVGQSALGAMAQAMNPAVQAYQQELGNQEAINHQMMQEHQRQQQAQAKQDYLMKMLQHKQAVEAQRHEDLQKHRTALLQLQRDKTLNSPSGGRGSPETPKYENVQKFPDKSYINLDKINMNNHPKLQLKSTADKYSSAYLASDEAYRRAEEGKGLIDEYENLVKNNSLDPTNPLTGKLARKIQEYSGYALKDKDMLDQLKVRKALHSDLMQIRSKAEGALEGGSGRLLQGLTKMYEKAHTFTDPEHMSFAEMRESMDRMSKRSLENAKVAQMIHKTGSIFSRSDIDKYVKRGEPTTENERAQHNAEFLDQGKKEEVAKPSINIPKTVFDARQEHPAETADMTDEEIERDLAELSGAKM